MQESLSERKIGGVIESLVNTNGLHLERARELRVGDKENKNIPNEEIR